MNWADARMTSGSHLRTARLYAAWPQPTAAPNPDISVTFFVLAAYVGIEALRTLVGGDQPEASWVGIGLAAFTAPTMPLLAYAKRRLGSQLHSAATVKQAAQTQLCAYLPVALLLGLGANALAGWWWADPLTALASLPSRPTKGARAGAAKAVAMLASGMNGAPLRRAPQ